MRGKSFALSTAALSLALLGCSAWIAHDPPIRRASTPEDFESVSIGFNILVAGAVPWLLQWAGLALALGAVAAPRIQLSRRAIAFATLLPLVVGATWWSGLSATYWTRDPLEAAFDALGRVLSRHGGVEPCWQFLLEDVVGPLVCPWVARGPGLPTGWEFLTTLASTGAVMAFWACVFTLGERAKYFDWRNAALAGGAAFIYFLPVYVRTTLRLRDAIGA